MSEDIVERLRQRISAFGTDRDRADAAAEIERLQAHVEALQQKIDADKSCACAYDSPDDVCLPHSPVVERLRNRITDLELKTFDLDVMARYEKEMSLTANANLTEALRLMEPVAKAAELYGNVHGLSFASVRLDDARAISNFVKRIKGE